MLRLLAVLNRLDLCDHKKLYKYLPEESKLLCKQIASEVRVPIPKWVRKKGHASIFGIFLESVIRSLFTRYATVNSADNDGILQWEDTKTTTTFLLELLQQEHKTKINFELEVCQSIVSSVKCLIKRFLKKAKSLTLEVESEFGSQELGICGHPDVIVFCKKGKIIPVEIKTTQMWDKMKYTAMIQLHTYVMLAKLSGYTVNKACLFLPLQKKCYFFDVKDWDFISFMLTLNEMKQGLQHRDEMRLEAMFNPKIDLRTVGAHTAKEKFLYASLRAFYGRHSYNIPVQIFLSSPEKWGDTKVDAKDLKATSEYILMNKIRAYVHAPYLINFCNPNVLPEKPNYPLNKLISELNFSVQLGMKGVVIHTGKCLKMGEEIGWKIMCESIDYVLSNSDERSVLLFETAAGQGTELATSPEDIVKLYKMFNEKYPSRFKICLDTCHVFAAGYDPYEFLDHLLKNKVEVPLIHYNGSLGEKGCKKDRHHHVNYPDQCIPVASLQSVLDVCKRLHIDCVVE